VDINETPLPGIGTRYDFTTSGGQRLAVISHHSGRRELAKYDSDDPDACVDLLVLNQDEAEDLGELLGSARFTGPLAEVQHRIHGLAIDWLDIRPRSPFAGRPLSDTQARTKTGVSIVAVARGEEAFPSPRPDFVFEAGDTLVVVGTPEGIRALTEILG
jgi:TrkA domain protein